MKGNRININRTARWAVLALGALAMVVRLVSAEPSVPRPPLAIAEPLIASGNRATELASAQRALELGLPTFAIDLYRHLLAQPQADRAGLTLPLASALLAAGRGREAELALAEAPGDRGLEWRLRMGLAAAQQKKFGEAADEANRIDVDRLTRPDRAWFWFLKGVIADTATPRDVSTANDYYFKAQVEAPSDFARATFLAAGLRTRLTLVKYEPADVDRARAVFNDQRRKGRNGYPQAEDYAVLLTAVGRKAEAVKFISDLLARVPKAEHLWADRFRRLLGLIGGRGRGEVGRVALTQLLENGTDPDLQRQALQILMQDSTAGAERALFIGELDKLIGATPKPAILDAMLMVRAQLALTDRPKDYATAERRATELKDDFPGSSLRPNALIVLATSAWEQKRYRLAADDARQAREAFAASPAAKSTTEAKVIAQVVSELRVLEAEASFRAGMLASSASDFRNAAEAYAAALQDPPPGIRAGDLLLQRALAEIRADTDAKTDLAKIIDRLETDPRFDPANRWEAEWSLARAMNIRGQTEAALARVTRLLAAASGVLPVAAELRARMSWLQARLSYEAGHPELTLQLLDKLDALTADVNAELRNEIASTAGLLRAQAEFRMGREAAALATLDKLRKGYPKTDAAIYSYLIAEAYYADQPGSDKIPQAQAALNSLINNPEYKQSEYIPYALFQLALLSERLGTEQDLRDANAKIESFVDPNRNPPAPNDLVFAARLKQGDLFRTLNQFPQAQRAYEALVNNPSYARRPDIVVAQLRLAECHNAQSSTDPTGTHADQAQSMFEELLYRVAASPDVRVEAGYNLGKLLERRGQFEKARDVWWRDVVTPFLVDVPRPLPTGAKRSYWLARTLLDLGELFEQRENVDEARRVYTLLRDSQLGYGETLAIEHLQRLGAEGGKSS